MVSRKDALRAWLFWAKAFARFITCLAASPWGLEGTGVLCARVWPVPVFAVGAVFEAACPAAAGAACLPKMLVAPVCVCVC